MGVLDFLFPKVCLRCGREGSYICPSCLAKQSLLKQVCPICEKASVDGFTHVKCKRKFGLDGLLSVWKYEGVVRKAILTIKYKYAREVVSELSEAIGKKLKETFIPFPSQKTLIPIPLYFLKENFRGFNQSWELGKEISEKVNWDFQPNLLVRKRLAQSQTKLTEEQRKENIKGVFAINPNYKLPIANCILFDDVYTTGSTLKEACKVLKRNGAEVVWGLAIAR